MDNALDVWLKFDPHHEDEDAAFEANTFRTTGGFEVRWYHTAVGQVAHKFFPTYEEAVAWLEAEGFQDFSS